MVCFSWNQSKKEMKQLLESIKSINLEQTTGYNFESHIFLDNALKHEDLQENGLQLLRLLPDTLGK